MKKMALFVSSLRPRFSTRWRKKKKNRKENKAGKIPTIRLSRPTDLASDPTFSSSPESRSFQFCFLIEERGGEGRKRHQSKEAFRVWANYIGQKNERIFDNERQFWTSRIHLGQNVEANRRRTAS